MFNYYNGYEVSANGDVIVHVRTDERYGYSALISHAEFQRISEESATAERGHSDLPKVRGMV